MKTKSDTAQRQTARKFVEYWTFQRGSEKGEDQQFWNSLLRFEPRIQEVALPLLGLRHVDDALGGTSATRRRPRRNLTQRRREKRQPEP